MGSSANFGVPGSGKTASVLGAFAFLRARGLVRRMVVLCPKNAFGSWRHEWAACFGGQRSCRSLCFHDAAFVHASTNTRRKELKFNAGRYDLILVNYEALGSYVKELSAVVSADALLVLDEVHKVKRIDGQWATQVLTIASHANRAVVLTGTPIPNSYCDLYNLLHILYPQDYDSYFGYSLVTLAHPTEAETRQINHALQPFFCRTDKRMLGVPPAAPEKTYRVSATVTEQSIFESLSRAYGFEHLSLIVRMLQLESDPAMLGQPLRPYELVGMFDEDEHEALQLATLAPEVTQMACGAPQTAKTSACLDLVEKLVSEGKQVLVWCFFRRSMHNLKSLMEGRSLSVEIINGEVAQDQRSTLLSDFRQRRLQVLVTNPQTLAESVSLHDVCHDAVYFEYSYNLVHLLQSKDRIHRLGLPAGQYTQYHFLQTEFDLNGEPWSLDANIYERLKAKEHAMLEAIDLGVLEVGATDARDLELVFRGLFGS